MPAYWRGAMTPHESNRAPHFVQQEVTGYDNMKELLIKLDAGNIHTDQIVLLFTASEANDGGPAKSDKSISRTWSTDCDIFEDVVELLHTKVLNPGPIGWLVKVRITRDDWRSDRCPYKHDEEFALVELPTMIVHNTMKRISGRKAFNMDNIITMLED